MPAFREGWIEADGFRIRYMEAGSGPPLIHLHGAGGLRLTPAHDALSQSFRVIAFEMPGFGESVENKRTGSMPELAATMALAASALDAQQFHVMGTSFGGKAALWLAVQAPERVLSLVLEAPAAIRPEGTRPVSGSPAEIAARLYAHPDRMPPMQTVDQAVAARQLSLVGRLRGPGRDPALEAAIADLAMPVLVMFGTQDSVVPPEMGRLYKDLIPGAHLVFVYDAGHAIAAERPEAFTEVVLDFLDRKDAFVISRSRTEIFP